MVFFTYIFLFLNYRSAKESLIEHEKSLIETDEDGLENKDENQNREEQQNYNNSFYKLKPSTSFSTFDDDEIIYIKSDSVI